MSIHDCEDKKEEDDNQATRTYAKDKMHDEYSDTGDIKGRIEFLEF